MSEKHIPIPVCPTCGKSGDKDYTSGETTYVCQNCGTVLRYLPAGELLTSVGNSAKKNNGWITKFSVISSELYTSRAMLALGILILLISLSFLYLGKIEFTDAIWSTGPAVFLIILGQSKLKAQKKKTKEITSQYPYWNK